MLVANLDPTLERAAAPTDPREVLERFPHGLVTQEVAEVMRAGNLPADRDATEAALIDLVAAGEAHRAPLGDDALWSLVRIAAA